VPGTTPGMTFTLSLPSELRSDRRVAHDGSDATSERFIAALFDAHAPSVARCAVRLLGPGLRDHAEDVVQEVFLVAHRRRDVVAAADNPRAWLLGVCVRQVQHAVRSKMRRRGLLARLLHLSPTPVAAPPADEGVATREERDEARAAVARALDSLSDDERAVFVLYELEDLSGKDIAAALAVNEKTVWSRLARARVRFAAAYDGDRHA
jgi:RNA polymerase sigma-70 factor (ECF subfamily)